MTLPTIVRIRTLIRSLNYVVSLHAAEELEDDNLTILDLENIILTGSIIERQKDRDTGETKTVIRGLTLGGEGAEAIVKASASEMLYIITIYLS